MIIGVEYKYAILAVLAGGIGGFLFFYYLSKPVNRGFNWLHPRVCAMVPNSMKLRFKSFCDRHKPAFFPEKPLYRSGENVLRILGNYHRNAGNPYYTDRSFSGQQILRQTQTHRKIHDCIDSGLGRCIIRADSLIPQGILLEFANSQPASITLYPPLKNQHSGFVPNLPTSPLRDHSKSVFHHQKNI